MLGEKQLFTQTKMTMEHVICLCEYVGHTTEQTYINDEVRRCDLRIIILMLYSNRLSVSLTLRLFS